MARRGAGIVATAALAAIASAFAAACAAGSSDRRPSEGFDPGIGLYLPRDPRHRSPEWGFCSSDPVSGLTDQLRVTWHRQSDGEFVESFLDLDFFPTAITGEGPERLFLAGLRAGEAVLVERTFGLEDSLHLGSVRTLLATDRIDTITSLRRVASPGAGERLVALDAPRARLWSFDLATSTLALLADGGEHPELVGKRSVLAVTEAGSRDVHYLLFEGFPFETSIGGADSITRLIDRGGDFAIDLYESMSGAEYLAEEDTGASPR